MASRQGQHGRARINRPEPALALSADRVSLMVSDRDGSVSVIGEAIVGSPDFKERIEALRIETIARLPAGAAIRLLLPPEQVLMRHLALPGRGARRAALAALESETPYRAAELAVDIAAPGPEGKSLVLAALCQSVSEARDHASGWGFVPGAVSTSGYEAHFPGGGPVFEPARRSAAVAVWPAAAAAGIAIAGGLAWYGGVTQDTPPSEPPVVVQSQAVVPISPARADPGPEIDTSWMLNPTAARLHALPEAAGWLDARPRIAAPEPAGSRLAALPPGPEAEILSDALALGHTLPATRRSEPGVLTPPAAPTRALERPAAPEAEPATPAATVEVPPEQPQAEDTPPAIALADVPIPQPRPSGAPFGDPAPQPVAKPEVADDPAPVLAEVAPVEPAPVAQSPSLTAPVLAPVEVPVTLPVPDARPETRPGTPDSTASVFAALSAPAPQPRPGRLVTRVPVDLARNPVRLAGAVPRRVGRAALQQGLVLDETNLIGIIDARGGRQALVRLPDGVFRRLSRGDQLEGWQVSSISNEAMRLTRNGQRRVLLLISR